MLEYLTNSIETYDPLIRRSSFLSIAKDRAIVRILLQHLRDVRNAVIHTDEERVNMSAYLEQLRTITEWMIRFHLREGNLFHSIADAGYYLDSPTDRGLLLERLRNYRRALRRVI